MENTNFKIVVINKETNNTSDVMFGNAKGDMLIAIDALAKNAPNHMVYTLVEIAKFEEAVKNMKSMMDSLFVYGGLKKESKYLTSYKETLGDASFDNLYHSYGTYLLKNYDIAKNTYTDCEGVTYNSLVRK